MYSHWPTLVYFASTIRRRRSFLQFNISFLRNGCCYYHVTGEGGNNISVL